MAGDTTVVAMVSVANANAGDADEGTGGRRLVAVHGGSLVVDCLGASWMRWTADADSTLFRLASGSVPRVLE